MPGRRQLLSCLPWVLAGTALALLAVGTGLRIAFPQGEDDSAFYASVSMAGLLGAPAAGALLAARLPANPYGWLWCGLGVTFGVLATANGLGRADVGPAWVWPYLEGSAFAVVLCLVSLVVLLFPTGRVPGPGWRWLARLVVIIPAAMLVATLVSPSPVDGAAAPPWAVGGAGGEALASLLDGGVTVMFLLALPLAGSVLYRFRHARPVERQQLKWFVLAAALIAATGLLDVLGLTLSDPVWAVVDAVTFGLLPVAVGVAVLRYRLYDVDRLISRTVSYALLSAGLAALFLGVGELTRLALSPVTGNSDLAVVVSTLVVAATFRPAHRRVQAVVDRRFDRARYDARRTVGAYAARLRDQVDLDEVTSGLRDTVATTVAPTRIGLWLRETSAGTR